MISWLEAIAILVSIISIIATAIGIFRLAQVQQTEFLDKMVTRLFDYYKKFSEKGLENESEKLDREEYLNFFEYLSFLIIKKKISESDAKELFKPTFLEIYKKMGKTEKDTMNHLNSLIEKWVEKK
ncbi:MAG: hypothetical protein Q7S21_00365 [archaeon]|nr:hypothetical protein [archaeon]